MALLRDNPAREVTDHGGSLSRAEALFPGAPKPWLDLSTGISPHPYPLSDLSASTFQRLPEPAQLEALMDAAAQAYGAPGAMNIAAAPGTQILLPLVAGLVAGGKAAILSPTYAEHRRAAAIAGHDVSEVSDFSALYDADLAVVVNPNNPDGRITARADLLHLAEHMRAKDGLLVIDEAFMDVGARAEALDGDVEAGGIVVLRSFGKFFGLAGIRLGFALAAHPVAEALRARLGPWAISGPALEIGRRALANLPWQAEMRERLIRQALELDTLLAENGLTVAGGTPLFRFLQTVHAATLFRSFGEDGILVRNFRAYPQTLRIGLPGADEEFRRLARSLGRWRKAQGQSG
ncbi:threonine-phosphate decarboxylase CobD [Chelativorans salis]|uniref:threonine-phosphate decarboxylase n=1 Tax=Chelativorans salis TaxID=2978478 RepID=A0ABT2LW91_9HYPH|nr:threonine-phosphate decarboxylase CobD [Chelativorans sp. EGI FJ00035]MCT7377658.1 threonine-phosphate decarboxylase CobD [Chelativorans sp. EGI FJ00035]